MMQNEGVQLKDMGEMTEITSKNQGLKWVPSYQFLNHSIILTIINDIKWQLKIIYPSY